MYVITTMSLPGATEQVICDGRLQVFDIALLLHSGMTKSKQGKVYVHPN